MTSRPTSIVVGDDIVVLMHIKNVLYSAGYEVVMARDCKRVFDQLDGTEALQGIIIDLPLEPCSSFMTDVRKMHERLGATIIFIGATHQPDFDFFPPPAKWYHWMAKPIDERKLIAALSARGCPE
jgi:PleD family two-component response regulator